MKQSLTLDYGERSYVSCYDEMTLTVAVYADVNGTVYNETLYMFCNIYDDDILLKT
jgi:hypothetical protein